MFTLIATVDELGMILLMAGVMADIYLWTGMVMNGQWRSLLFAGLG